MQTSTKQDINHQGKSKQFGAKEWYKIFHRQERIRENGSFSLYFQNRLREETQKRMSSKKNKTANLGKVDRSFALKKLIAKTENQQETIDAYDEGYNLILSGVAGTGKTFLSLSLAIGDVISGKYNKVVIIRNVVPTRDMGFLPGTETEKTAVYEAPYIDICSELFGRGDAYNILKTKGSIEFITTSFIRGITIRNAVIIVDEFQNCNFHELDTVMTRIDDSSRIIFSGDIVQTDLCKPNDKSGLPKFIDILDDVWDEDKPNESFVSVEFGIEDIVRGGLVKNYIKSKAKAR